MRAKQLDEIFNTVYESLYPVLFRVAYRVVSSQVLAEDLCHEAFIKYYERKNPLPDLNQTKYWLIRVIRNIALNYEKKKLREKKAYDKLKRSTIHFAESGEAEIIKEETRSFVQEALSKLPYNLRIVLVLKEYADLNYKEIGTILGIREGNVKIRVYRARERLAKLLKEDTNVS